MEAVSKSIVEYGFRQPIVVDKHGVIVVGHTRWKAAKALGLAKVPVHVATDLTPDKAKAYRLADNRTALIAQWDDPLLAVELGELKALDIDLGGLGFTPRRSRSCSSRGLRREPPTPMTSPRPLRRPTRSRATSGSWVGTGCCAATAAASRTWIGCWMGPLSILLA